MVCQAVEVVSVDQEVWETCRKDRWIRVQNELVLDTLQDQVLQDEGDWEL